MEFVDIYPTLCDLCGVPVPDGLEGLSMARLMASHSAKRPAWKTAAFSQFPRYPGAPGQSKNNSPTDAMGYSMRTPRYRYTAWIDRQSGETIAQELYDYQNDPDETVNRATWPEHAALIKHMAQELAAGWRGALPM